MERFAESIAVAVFRVILRLQRQIADSVTFGSAQAAICCNVDPASSAFTIFWRCGCDSKELTGRAMNTVYRRWRLCCTAGKIKLDTYPASRLIWVHG